MQRGEVNRAVERRTVQKEIHGSYKAYDRPLVSRLRPVQTEEDVCQLFEEILGAMLAKQAVVHTVTAALTVPPAIEETQLRSLMRYIDTALALYDWKLADLQVRTDREIRVDEERQADTEKEFRAAVFGLLAVSAAGTPLSVEERQSADGQAEGEARVLLVGYPGAAGVKRLYQGLCAQGLGEFHGSRVIGERLHEADTTAAGRSVVKLVQTAGRLRIKIAAWPLGEGGLFTALYDLAHSQNRGMQIELPEVPVTAATVALCEREALDPYRLWSNGSYLLVTEDAAAVIDRIGEQAADWPWPVTVIGRITAEGGLCLRRARSQSSIEKPAIDELYRWEEEKRKR